MVCRGTKKLILVIVTARTLIKSKFKGIVTKSIDKFTWFNCLMYLQANWQFIERKPNSFKKKQHQTKAMNKQNYKHE